MCVNQTTIPGNFPESYGKIESTQKEIDNIFDSYWSQQTKRIDYTNKYKHSDEIDHIYIISMLKSEQLLLDELREKNILYSKQVSDFYEILKEVKGDDAKSEANNLIISLRKSQQYLGNTIARYSSATNSVGILMNYSASDANFSDPEIKEVIDAEGLTARTDFAQGDQYLGQYYLAIGEANIAYQQILKMK